MFQSWNIIVAYHFAKIHSTVWHHITAKNRAKSWIVGRQFHLPVSPQILNILQICTSWLFKKIYCIFIFCRFFTTAFCKSVGITFIMSSGINTVHWLKWHKSKVWRLRSESEDGIVKAKFLIFNFFFSILKSEVWNLKFEVCSPEFKIPKTEVGSLQSEV